MIDPARAEHRMEALRAYYRQIQKNREERWKEHADTFPQLRTWLDNVARAGRQNLQNIVQAIRAAREYGPLVAQTTGVSVATQIMEQLRLYKTYRVPADCYYALGMYEEKARGEARFFLADKPASVLLHHLARTAPNEKYKPLHEKIAFWKHCRNHGLPTVPVLSVFSDGALKRDYGEVRTALPSRDLFSKPVTSFLGRGARKWTYMEEGVFKDDSGRTYAPEAVTDALKRQSHRETLLLQPCVYDPPELQELTGTAGPSTLRIITSRFPGGSPEYFRGFLTMPLREEAAPTFKGGTALAASVNAETGQLGRLFCKRSDYLLGGRDQHPNTGRRLRGIALPQWDDAKALALQAHATLPTIACVGWDVMLTDSGPRLLEGNYDCSAALTQVTHQQLLGRTRFPEYLTAHLQRQM